MTKRLLDMQGAALDAVRLLGGGYEAEAVLRDTVRASTHEDDAAVVAAVVRKYVRRSAWAGLVERDLAQEGHAALAKARQRFDPEKGDWGGYAYMSAWKAIASYLVAESSPVTRKEKGAANLARRAPEDAITGFIAADDTEDLYGEEEWRRRVRARLITLSGDPDIARILLEETTPAKLATERAVPVSRVYGLVAAARSRVAKDSALYALMQAKKGVDFLAGEQE